MPVASSARWIASSQAARGGVQLLGLLLLSRILAPADFGLVAMAAVVTNFANVLKDLGTAAAVIQKEQLQEETIRTAFWLNLLMGFALGVGIAALSPVFARLFRTPELTGILLSLAVTFPIACSSNVHQALLERSSRFPVVARVEVIAAITGLAAALGAAHLGAGAYSLVVQTLTSAVVSSIQLWLVADWRPSWGFSTREVSTLWRFAGPLVGFNIINYFSRNADNLIIGRVLGAEALGAYSLAYRIMLFPVQTLTWVAGRALFPVMSKRQSFPDELANLYLRTLSVIAFFTAPMMAGLFVLREPFVQVVLGSKWSAVTDIVALLAAAGFIQSLLSTVGTVFAARGRTDMMFRLGVFGAIVQVSAFLIGLRWGVTGVAACYLVANVIVAFPCLFFALKQVDRHLSDLAAAVWRPVVLALLMALALADIRSAIPSLAALRAIPLVTLVCIGSLIYVSGARLFSGTVLRDVVRLISKR